MAIAAGSNHTCAIDPVGAVQCWGAITKELMFLQASWALVIAAGRYQTCAIDSVGAIECWGINMNGELRAGEQEAVVLAAGSNHSCVTDAVSGVGAGVKRLVKRPVRAQCEMPSQLREVTATPARLIRSVR